MMISHEGELARYLEDFTFFESHQPPLSSFDQNVEIDNKELKKTVIDKWKFDEVNIPKYVNEFWTSKQRKASSIHEISYRACFKPQLPRFFINLFTNKGDIVYDPFAGRGTTIIEAGLLGRNIVSNDINPLSKILSYPRFNPPGINDLEERLYNIPLNEKFNEDIDLSMFYHQDTLKEIVSLKNYLKERRDKNAEDALDSWIRMIATNRLTGHSSGFFSVYTLPPNQAVSQISQMKINKKRNQIPDYRDIRKIIIKKSRSVLRNISKDEIDILKNAGKNSQFLNEDVRQTKDIKPNYIQLIVTSPPFLNIVQYASDNWLRCWFNSIDATKVGERITMSKTVEDWNVVMGEAFKEFNRIVKKGGWIAFEVGEVRNGKVRLEEFVVPLGINAGFKCRGILINSQDFTKTSNIWGINNMDKGTNTNRIVIFEKM